MLTPVKSWSSPPLTCVARVSVLKTSGWGSLDHSTPLRGGSNREVPERDGRATIPPRPAPSRPPPPRSRTPAPRSPGTGHPAPPAARPTPRAVAVGDQRRPPQQIGSQFPQVAHHARRVVGHAAPGRVDVLDHEHVGWVHMPGVARREGSVRAPPLGCHAVSVLQPVRRTYTEPPRARAGPRPGVLARRRRDR